jgi:hypothetical protein
VRRQHSRKVKASPRFFGRKILDVAGTKGRIACSCSSVAHRLSRSRIKTSQAKPRTLGDKGKLHQPSYTLTEIRPCTAAAAQPPEYCCSDRRRQDGRFVVPPAAAAAACHRRFAGPPRRRQRRRRPSCYQRCVPSADLLHNVVVSSSPSPPLPSMFRGGVVLSSPRAGLRTKHSL